MGALATQRCIEVKQEISPLEKKIVENSFEMKLFDEEIKVKNDTYPITSVFDISYRIKDGDHSIGYLYLHTSRGVRTFHIKEEPVNFINAYKKIKSERSDM